jgi:hypothetical protein
MNAAQPDKPKKQPWLWFSLMSAFVLLFVAACVTGEDLFYCFTCIFGLFGYLVFGAKWNNQFKP